MRKDWIQAEGVQQHDMLVCCTILRQAWDTGYVEVVLQLGQISEWLNRRHANYLQGHVSLHQSFGKSVTTHVQQRSIPIVCYVQQQ